MYKTGSAFGLLAQLSDIFNGGIYTFLLAPEPLDVLGSNSTDVTSRDAVQQTTILVHQVVARVFHHHSPPASKVVSWGFPEKQVGADREVREKQDSC